MRLYDTTPFGAHSDAQNITTGSSEGGCVLWAVTLEFGYINDAVLVTDSPAEDADWALTDTAWEGEGSEWRRAYRDFALLVGLKGEVGSVDAIASPRLQAAAWIAWFGRAASDHTAEAIRRRLVAGEGRFGPSRRKMRPARTPHWHVAQR